MADKSCNVIVLDMQPIDPPVGGGRLRLLGLYHDLGPNIRTRYIGTYDWPGERARDHNLSDTLREINIPLSDHHFAECRKMQERVGDKTIIDVTFHQLAYLSPQFVDAVRRETSSADVVILSHPWVFPLVRDLVDRRKQTVVYDAQNVEGYLRYTLLDDGGPGTDIVKEVVRIEYELCHFSDFILVCSHEDREMFNKLYAVPFEKMKVVPNGVFTKKIKPVSPGEKDTIKQQLGLAHRYSAIFIGSNYPPNLEAAEFITDWLAPQLPDVVFVIAGGVGTGLDQTALQNLPNVVVTGFLDNEKKLHYLSASDIAINPMFGGSGTNIKMFDFMAAGLPILSTEIGARGIETGTTGAVQLCDKNTFPEKIQSVLCNTSARQTMSLASRRLAEEKYSWEMISNQLGLLIDRLKSTRTHEQPFFSVIIPSYNRHDNLNELMKALAQQTWSDFEVIIVDQSAKRWEQAGASFGLDLFYLHTDIKGAVKARNRAVFYSRGKVLAFTDDDCIPAPDWLQNAKERFDRHDIIGIEGLILSDKLNDPAYRPVTNNGFPGFGYMTANLFLRSEVFARINGFDERFDHPHFREDTDLAWRALEYGAIPFGEDVSVFHPPHLRTIERESHAERNKYFEKDALLLQKHPRRYMELFLRERHWERTPGFWDNFMRGAIKYGINPDDYEVMRYYPGEPLVPPDSVTPTRSKMMTTRDLSLDLAEQMLSTRMNLSTKIPLEILAKLPLASSITEQVKKIIGDKTHGGYFDSSVERYNQYFSIAAAFLAKGATILDIGNAPGHVGIGLHLLGMNVQGLNLNDCWHSTYPSPEWLKTFNVISHDIEANGLPFDDNMFDAILFTEVLEHIAIKNPVDILSDMRRVLKSGGLLILSTPNVCNISNISALMNGENIFWPKETFYGSLDRHNREYTPDEVAEVVLKAGFGENQMYGFNCSSNWRQGGADFANKIIRLYGDNLSWLRNTIMLYAYK